MVSKKVVIRNALGLHLRPAGDLCQKAVEYESTRIMLHFRDREFNAKSVISVLSACARQDDEIEIVCTGPQEEEALQALVDLFQTERMTGEQ